MSEIKPFLVTGPAREVRWMTPRECVLYSDHIAIVAELERDFWVRLGQFRKALETANLHGHYNLFQEWFGEEADIGANLIAELRGEVERLKAERFAPLGDNHHNAAKCPYCNPQLVGLLAERDSLTAQLAAMQWISVKERLPESGAVVLGGNFDNPKKMRQQFVCIYGSKRGWHMYDDDEGITVRVTHWMPLPNPPKEQSNG